MYDDNFKTASGDLMSYCKEHLGYDNNPSVEFVTDENNSKSMLGRTAHYEPANQAITVYISNRHPKDALRSLAHELVHHAQNMRGDLKNVQTPEGYAQKDSHMRSMEEEAYLKGNMLFRDWEDSHKSQTNSPISIGEQKMDQLKDLIKEKVVAILKESNLDVVEAISDGAGAPMSVPVGQRHRAKQMYRRGFEDASRGVLPRNLADLDDPNYRAGAEEGHKEYMLHRSPYEDEIEEAAKPDFPDVDGDGDRKEPISKAQKDKKEKEGKSGKKPAGKAKKGEIPPQLRKHVKAKQDKKGDEEKVEEEIGPRGGSEVSIDPEKGLKIAEIDQHIQRKLGGIKNLTQLMAQRDAMAGEQMYSRFNEALSDILDMQLEEQEASEVQEESETVVNPLSEVKKSQNSINNLKNIKLERINEALMSRLIK